LGKGKSLIGLAYDIHIIAGLIAPLRDEMMTMTQTLGILSRPF